MMHQCDKINYISLIHDVLVYHYVSVFLTQSPMVQEGALKPSSI